MIRTNIEEIYNTNEEPNKIDFSNGRNIIYFNRRKELKQMVKSINTYVNNNSQSLFLTYYFMDLIFTNNDLEKVFFQHFNLWDYLIPLKDIQMNNYALLSVACLIISYKFTENDPKVPSMSSFVKLLYHYSKKNFIFSAKDLIAAEVVALKLLKYKLNYYTIYQFFVFFFTHGIIFKKTLYSSQLFSKLSEKKILEKIYIQAREILDWIIDSEDYYNYYFGKDNHIIVVVIILWSIEHILDIKIQNDENIFKLIFNINIKEEKYNKIVEIIEKLYLLKKGSLQNINKPIFSTKNYSKKTITFNNQLSFPSMKEGKNSNYNYNSIQNLNGNIASSYNNIYNTLPPYEESFSFYNGLIHNELNKVNSNYPYQYILQSQNQYQPNIEKEKNNKILTKVIGLKNKAFYNSNKNITSNYDINSIIPIKNSVIQNIPSNFNLINNENNIEKEPTDSDKNKKRNKINTNINKNSDDIREIELEDIQGKKISANKENKFKKKSLSCSKNPNSSISNFNSHYATFIDTTSINNNEDELKFKEKINRPKIFDNKIKININNYLYSISPSQQIKENKNNNKETLFKKYQQATSEYSGKLLNKNLTSKHIPKSKIISTEELIKKTKNLFTVTKINQTVENEPRDNNRRSVNKLKKKNENNNYNSNNINKINKLNTIIINNNIHINTFIDNQNYNNNKSINDNINKNNSKIFIFNNINNNNVSELLTLPNIGNKYKNNKN